jgi:hypothetical protein
MAKEDNEKPILAWPALLHQLSERLMAAGNYLKVAQRGAVTPHAAPQSAELLDMAVSQIEEASRLVHHLRETLAATPPVPDDAGRDYRVCFFNRFARGRQTVTACQRTIVVRGAESREAAVEAAKQQFAEIEGIPDWHIHASMIEAGLLADDATDQERAGGRLGTERSGK